MAWYEAAILIVIAVGAGYFVYAKEFRQKTAVAVVVKTVTLVEKSISNIFRDNA